MAQSKSFVVEVQAVRPAPSCSIGTINDLTFANAEIPWSGTANYNASTTATVTYTNTTSITTSIGTTTFSYDGGNITGTLSTSPTSKTVTGSSTPQNTNFTINGSVTLNASTTPGTYNTLTRGFIVSCTN